MNSKVIMRLLKAGCFIFALIFYGLSSGIKSQLLFAICLALFLIELYGGKNDGRD